MFTSFNARALGLSLSGTATVDLAARTGFEGVDLMVRDLVDAGEDPFALRTRMDDLGLRGGAFPMPVDWRSDTAAFARDLARLPRLAETAAVLGVTRTGTWVMPETPPCDVLGASSATAAQAATVALHVERLGAIARVLDASGIRLGLEVIGVASFRTGRGLPFVHRMADLDGLLGSLWPSAPNLGVVVDGWHLYAAGETVETGLAWGAERVVWVHVADLPADAGPNPDRATMNDNDRGLPGEHGTIDTRELLQRLRQSRPPFDGPVTAEPMPGCRSLIGLEPDAKAERVLATLRSVWP